MAELVQASLARTPASAVIALQVSKRQDAQLHHDSRAPSQAGSRPTGYVYGRAGRAHGAELALTSDGHQGIYLRKLLAPP